VLAEEWIVFGPVKRESRRHEQPHRGACLLEVPARCQPAVYSGTELASRPATGRVHAPRRCPVAVPEVRP
jgi:hypothetical protein